MLGWSSNTENPVGAEYIFLEKIDGIPLSDKWNSASDIDRYKIIERIVEMERELTGLHFPAYGSLYLRDSLPQGSSRCLLDSSLDPSESFCIGPSCSRSWWESSLSDTTGRGPERGPCQSNFCLFLLTLVLLKFKLTVLIKGAKLTDFAMAKVNRAISIARSHHDDETGQKNQQLVEEHIRLLDFTKELIPDLASHPMIVGSSASILWHTDLHLGNILVSNDDSTTIEGVIDWQSCSVAPSFLQCRVPAFLKRPKDYVKGTKAPKLPDDFDQLDTIQRQRAILEKSFATKWKMYEMYTFLKNRDVYNALEVDRRLWEPFARCGEWSSTRIVPLRSSLIRVFNDWSLLVLPGECPFTFTKTELKKHEEELKQHQDRVYLLTLAKDQLSTDDEGWVPIPEWDSVRAENQDLLDTFIETMADEMSKEDAMKMWPFSEEVT